MIFAEKPLTKTLPEALEIKQLYSSLPISVQLNYSRRFVPEIIRLRNNIKDGLHGRYLSGTGYYGKGLLHNGSHLLDLLHNLLGDIHDYRLTSVINDFYDDDPSVSAVLTVQDGVPFFLQSIDCRAYTIFEMDLLFERGRIRLIDSDLSLRIRDKGKPVICRLQESGNGFLNGGLHWASPFIMR